MLKLLSLLVLVGLGWAMHHGGKRNEIDSWEGGSREHAADDIHHLARSSNGNYNGHVNESIDIKVFERIREHRNMTGTLNEVDISKMRVYNVGVLMASHLGKCLKEQQEQKEEKKLIQFTLNSRNSDSPFDLERCGPAVDLALDQINKRFLSPHNIRLVKKKAR